MLYVLWCGVVGWMVCVAWPASCRPPAVEPLHYAALLPSVSGLIVWLRLAGKCNNTDCYMLLELGVHAPYICSVGMYACRRPGCASFLSCVSVEAC